MDLRLEGKRALVTGSSSGMGRAIAVTLGQEGAALIVTGRDGARAEETATAKLLLAIWRPRRARARCCRKPSRHLARSTSS